MKKQDDDDELPDQTTEEMEKQRKFAQSLHIVIRFDVVMQLNLLSDSTHFRQSPVSLASRLARIGDAVMPRVIQSW